MVKSIKVLGMGCVNCETTIKTIQAVALETGADVKIEKIDDIQKIVAYGVMATPAVVIDEKVVHAGGLPAREMVKKWFGEG